MADDRMKFMIEDAQLVFRNFAGKEDQYTRAGDRSFSVILDPKTAETMAKDGWNVKQLRGDEEEPGDYYIQVAVSYKNRPPKVVMMTSTSRTMLNEENVEVLDYADIRTADLIATAYHWDVNGKTGIKAYLQSLFVTIEEDELERKYAINEVD